MWKTSTLQQFLKWTYIFMLMHMCNCYQQYCFTNKSNHKKHRKRAERTFYHKRLLEITSWSRNLCCLTNYWVDFFCCLVVFFLSFNLWLRSILLSYCCVLRGLNSRWNPAVDTCSLVFFPLSALSWCARTELPVHLHPHSYPGFDCKWTVGNMVPQAEEGHPGGTAKWTVKFSCVISLPMV